jgi:uncharacterized protein with HEPN domain
MSENKFDIMQFTEILKDTNFSDDISIKDIKLNDKDYLNKKFGIKRYLFNNILDSIETINFAFSSKIDSKIVQSSIYMNIMRVDEEFNKLKDDCESEVLQKFDSEDLKFIREIRNLIEFNYEKIEHKDIYIIVKKVLPNIKNIIENID